MPDVTFWCSQCGHRQQVPDRLIGRKVRCPKCDTKQILRVIGGTTSTGSGGAGTTTIMRRETATISRPAPAPPSQPAQASSGNDPSTADELSLDGVEFEPHADDSRAAASASVSSATFSANAPGGTFGGSLAKNTLPVDQRSLQRLGQSGSVGNDLITIRPTGNEPAAPVAIAAGYELSRELGRGGMGAVWSSTQNSLARTVAIKTLLAGQEGNSAANRFRAEAMIMALLEHPNIMPVHDLIVSERGELQLVMKKIDGLAWRDLLYPATETQVKRSLSMTLNDHLDILLKVCDALAFAHTRGILHLDVKPANVMVGAFGEVLLLDWGCALAYRDLGNAALPNVVGYRGLSGTPAYMAPEMAKQTGDLGPWTDGYLLGAVLYELVTGTAPHKAETVHSSLSLAAANTIHPPSRQRGKAIATELIELARGALDSDRNKRPATIEVFAQQVRGYRAHAEAITLVETAKHHLEDARRGGDRADDGFRLALAACDQALALWPDYQAAQEEQALITLAYADFSLASGAFQVAQAKARAVEATATRLKLDDLVKRAQQLHDQALSEERFQHARSRNIRVLLISIGTLMAVGVVVLIVGLSFMGDAKAKLNEEMKGAKASVEELTRERGEKASMQKRVAPVLLKQAQRDLDARRLDDALTSIDQALDFYPKFDDALWLKANVLAAKKNYPAAVIAVGAYLARKPDVAAAKRLQELVTAAVTKPTPQLEAQLGEFFIANRLIPLADGRKLTKEALGIFYISAFDAFWPGAGRFVQVDDERILFAHPSGPGGKDPLSGAGMVVDLSPLRDLPIAELALADTRVTDLAPLAGMPLKRLDLTRTPVRDLTPLIGMPLERLELGETNVVDLAALTGMPLHTLSLAKTGVADLQPLIGRPLKQLDLSETRVADLSALKYLKLERLSLDGTRVARLDMLQPMPLAWLSLRNAGIADLADLSGAQVRGLDLSGNANLQNLAPLTGLTQLEELVLDQCPNLSSVEALAKLPLKRLSIVGTRITDLSPLAGLPLERLDFEPKNITKGMDALRAIGSLTNFGPAPVQPAAAFWRRYDQGQ